MADHSITPEDLDQWFQHPSSEGVPQLVQRVNTGLLFSALFALVVTLVVVTACIAVYADGQIAVMRAERDMNLAGAESALAYRAGALTQQDQAAWIDRSAETVRLPLDASRQQNIEEYAGR